MAKKKKIREDFDVIFASGNEKAIKEMLDKYPWLLDDNYIDGHFLVVALLVREY